MKRFSHYRRLPIGLLGLILMTVLIMTGVVFVDRDWTLFLSHHKLPRLMEFMGQTLFEGEPPGANDPIVIYLLLVVVYYFFGWFRPWLKLPLLLRPHTGFMLTSALVGGLYIVHGLKWVVGRARPGLVIKHGWPFTDWFEFGPHFITEGIYYGSFISGHTAQAFMLMGIAYALAGDPLLRRPYRILGWVIGFMVLLFSLTMGVARCMSLSHWVSDILGALLSGWIIMHWLYHYILRVPDQRRYLAAHGRLPQMPKLWELSISGYLLLVTIGAMQVVLGIRSILLLHLNWLILMIPLGLWLIRMGVKGFSGILDRLTVRLEPE